MKLVTDVSMTISFCEEGCDVNVTLIRGYHEIKWMVVSKLLDRAFSGYSSVPGRRQGGLDLFHVKMWSMKQTYLFRTGDLDSRHLH